MNWYTNRASWLVAVPAVALWGLAKAPIENSVHAQEVELGLLPPPTQLEPGEAMEQQLAMVSLGGLRSLVAAFLSIDAFQCFMMSDWPMLEKRYNQVVALAPHTLPYWDQGTWYLGYNAASSIRESYKLTELEQEAGYKEFVEKGKKFIVRGIKANPNDWELYERAGSLYGDALRYPDYAKAAEFYKDAADLTKSATHRRMEFYMRAKTPEDYVHAWRLGRELAQDRRNMVPSFSVIMFAIQNRLNIPVAERVPFDSLFMSNKYAKQTLLRHLENPRGYPIDGVKEALEHLSK